MYKVGQSVLLPRGINAIRVQLRRRSATQIAISRSVYLLSVFIAKPHYNVYLVIFYFHGCSGVVYVDHQTIKMVIHREPAHARP